MYAFGDFVLDTQLFQLRMGEHVIPLEPKVFDVLRYLVENSDRVATKRELLSALWPNEVVTEAVLPTNINALRRALGQKRGEKWPIETVHGRGYRLSMPVTKTLTPRPTSPAFALASLEPGAPVATDGALFVDRPALMGRLQKLLARALSEQGQLCVLSGEAGIGKTRLAFRLADLARGQGASVWTAVCSEGPDAPSLWPWQQVMRAALQSEGVDTLRTWLGPSAVELATWVPELSPHGPAAANAGDDPGTFRLFESVLRVLLHASEARPRVILLEDMHRADNASWQLLGLLAPHLERAAALVIVTLRSRDDLTVAAPVQRNVEGLLRAPHCQTFYVRGLEEAETHALMRKLLGRDVDEDLASLVQSKTGGNPLFIRELADWMDASGSVTATALREAPDLAPPEMVRHVLKRRVSRLGETAQQALEAGAVLGSRWDAWSVARVSGLPREQVLEAVDAAIAQRIVVTDPDRLETYRFANDLVRDTLRAELATALRKQMHLRAAEYFEEKLPWLGPRAVHDVALHFYQALPEGNAHNAIQWLERAANEAATRSSHSEAARLYRWALDATRLLPHPDPELQEKLRASRVKQSELSAQARERAEFESS